MSQPTYSVHVYNPPLLEYLQAVEFGDDEVVRHLSWTLRISSGVSEGIYKWMVEE